jgi:hypothetical protein
VPVAEQHLRAAPGGVIDKSIGVCPVARIAVLYFPYVCPEADGVVIEYVFYTLPEG